LQAGIRKEKNAAIKAAATVKLNLVDMVAIAAYLAARAAWACVVAK